LSPALYTPDSSGLTLGGTLAGLKYTTLFHNPTIHLLGNRSKEVPKQQRFPRTLFREIVSYRRLISLQILLWSNGSGSKR
jgi:hypothetical protein